MRIRKEHERWKWTRFFKLLAVFLIVYNAFFFFAGYAQGGIQASDELTFWLITGLVLPALIAAMFTLTSRKATLFITPDHTPDDTTALITMITDIGFRVDTRSENEIHFVPTSAYHNLMGAWFKTEDLNFSTGSEITIQGPSRRIQQLEEKLSPKGRNEF